jgi:hypothetical protein
MLRTAFCRGAHHQQVGLERHGADATIAVLRPACKIIRDGLTVTSAHARIS